MKIKTDFTDIYIKKVYKLLSPIVLSINTSFWIKSLKSYEDGYEI
jgi:hypothetical protein